MKIFKIVLQIVISLVILAVLIFGIYLIYLYFTEYKPDDIEDLDITNVNSSLVPVNKELSILTYNIGFAAYTPPFSFFFEGGSYSKAISKESAENCLNNDAKIINDLDLDFFLLQEIDITTPRGANIDQKKYLEDRITYPYSYTYAINHKVGFLAAPLWDLSGKIDSGLFTGSKYKVSEAKRVNLPGQSGWPMSMVFEKPCLTVYRMPTDNGKDFIMINGHLSAYDEGGKARKAQLELLQSIIEKEYNKGNYVIMGGDWNHVYPEIDPEYFSKPYNIPLADYYLPFPTNIFKPEHFKMYGDYSSPTNRTVSRDYVKNETYTSVLDWFVVSDNIEVEFVKVQNKEFEFSDHQPVLMKFKLK